MSGSLRAVLFDVDGTLVDTNYLHTVTWWQAFAQGGQHVAMADIHRAIGMGSDQLLDRLLPDDRDKDADGGRRRRMTRSTPRTGPGCGRCRARLSCSAHASSAA